MSSGLIDITEQCCDADEYLDMGYACAKAGLCYNPLRPIGDTLWFGIPYAFNTNENIFFYLHVFLFALLGISVFCLLKKLLPTIMFLLALLFLSWPTFFHTLSDTPATLFFMEGVVLALIGMNRNSTTLLFMAGISLGLSALLRAAYFYPLIVASIPFIIYWLCQKKRQWRIICIISFIIPLSLQFFSTWQHTHHWSFLSKARGQQMMKFHLSSDAAGYDTSLPQNSVYWLPDCTTDAGLLPSLKSFDISSSFCILKSRLSFYLGSYAPSTYPGEGVRNFFDNNYAQNTKTGHFIQTKSITPLPAGEYRHTVSLWTGTNNHSQPVQLQVDNITFVNPTEGDPVSQQINTLLNQSITITDTPQRYAVHITNNATGYIIVRINSSEKFNLQDEWLEDSAATMHTVFQPSQHHRYVINQNTTLTKNGRVFSSVYFLINCMIVLFASFYLFRLLAQTRSPIVLFVAALLLSVIIQCMIIIPEQRFIQSFLSACWLLCFLHFVSHQRSS